MSNFKRFKNSFSEEATDLAKTRFDELSSDDFAFTNEIKTSAKFKLKNGGAFKLTNKVKTSDKGDAPVYSTGTDAEFTAGCPACGLDARWKVKSKGIQAQLDLGKRALSFANVHPYLRLDIGNALNDPVPSVGVVSLTDQFKSHTLFTLKGREVSLSESGVFKSGPWTLAGVTSYVIGGALKSYVLSAAWADSDSELSLETGSETSGFVAPGYVNLNLWFSKDRYTFGAQVQNNTNNWSDRVFRAAIGAKISPEFFVKAAMDNQNSQEFFLKYKMCPSATLGLALQMQNQPAEGFKGYLDYPFNFGLTLKLDQ